MTLLPDKVTPVPIGELMTALAVGYRKSLGSDPVSAEQLSCLGAQLCLESGNGLKNHLYNFGNRKARDDDEFTCTFRCDEIFDHATTEQAKRLGPCDARPWHAAPDGSALFRVILLAGHPWAMFAAFQTAEDGCRDYCDFLSGRERYRAAWSRAYHGDAPGFSRALHDARYYTADVETYTRGLVSIAQRLAGASNRILAGLPHYLSDETIAHVTMLVAASLPALADEALHEAPTDPAPAPPESVA